MEQAKIAIIGAGLAGLACANKLADAGVATVVYDKGRGAGGRLSTRRAEGGLQFDHGAQYLTARRESFHDVLSASASDGSAALWNDGEGLARYVGAPGMNALPKRLGERLDIRQSALVTALRPAEDLWVAAVNDDETAFERIVVTAPAPQAATLLNAAPELASEVAQAQLTPCITLMAAFAPNETRPFVARRDPQDALAWIACDASKPGRPETNCWVAQASPEWSMEHLEESPDRLAQRMLPLLCDRLGVGADQVIHASAHRWRYAAVLKPLGKPFARSADGKLYAGGDWCLEARAEAAWISGEAIAQDILASQTG